LSAQQVGSEGKYQYFTFDSTKNVQSAKFAAYAQTSALSLEPELEDLLDAALTAALVCGANYLDVTTYPDPSTPGCS
jgi:hypothetical protein